jgi:hypothetical protein
MNIFLNSIKNDPLVKCIEQNYYTSELCILGKKYLVDKSPFFGNHTYTPQYHKLLKHRKNNIDKILEIGIGNIPLMSPLTNSSYIPGASLRMWRDYFPKAKIFGCDILENVLFNFLNDISKMTLQQLVDFQLSYKRSITPGFIGFGKGSFADALVDNEIYLRRMKGEKGYPSDEFAKIRGQKPVIDKPSYSLLTGDVFVRFAPYIGKGAKQITTEKTQSYTDSVKKKKEKKAIDSGCLF